MTETDNKTIDIKRAEVLKRLFDEGKLKKEDMTLEEKKALLRLYKTNIRQISLELNEKLDYLIKKDEKE